MKLTRSSAARSAILHATAPSHPLVTPMEAEADSAAAAAAVVAQARLATLAVATATCLV